MKILIVIDSLGSGGAQRIAAYLAQGLYKKDHLVEVFVYNDRFNFFKSDFERFNIKIHTVNNNIKSTNTCNKSADNRSAFIQFLKSCSSDAARQQGITNFINRYNINESEL